MMSVNDTLFQGLVYTCGDLNAELESNTGTFTIQGAMIVAGKDPDLDPEGSLYNRGIMNINKVNGCNGTVDIKFDNSILNILTYNQGGLKNGFIFCSWHEF